MKQDHGGERRPWHVPTRSVVVEQSPLNHAPCTSEVDFTDIVKDVLIAGLVDDETRKDVLGWAEVDDKTVEETVTLVEAKRWLVAVHSWKQHPWGRMRCLRTKLIRRSWRDNTAESSLSPRSQGAVIARPRWTWWCGTNLSDASSNTRYAWIAGIKQLWKRANQKTSRVITPVPTKRVHCWSGVLNHHHLEGVHPIRHQHANPWYIPGAHRGRSETEVINRSLHVESSRTGPPSLRHQRMDARRIHVPPHPQTTCGGRQAGLRCDGNMVPEHSAQLCDVNTVTDTGAQSCLCGVKDFYRCGFKDTDLVPVARIIVAANREEITVLGTILLRLRGTDSQGNHTLSYLTQKGSNYQKVHSFSSVLI